MGRATSFCSGINARPGAVPREIQVRRSRGPNRGDGHNERPENERRRAVRRNGNVQCAVRGSWTRLRWNGPASGAGDGDGYGFDWKVCKVGCTRCFWGL